jgi:hypothetical protein
MSDGNPASTANDSVQQNRRLCRRRPEERHQRRRHVPMLACESISRQSKLGTKSWQPTEGL